MKTESRPKRMWLSLVLVLALALGVALTGCQSGDSNASGSGLTSAVDSEITIEPLTINDVRAKVALTSDQETLMAAALDRYNRAVETNRAQRMQARNDGERGFHPRGGERPLHTLLMESADLLDASQMVDLLAMVKERQDERRSQKRQNWSQAGNGRGLGLGQGARSFGHDGSHPMFADLDLTDAQQAQLDKLREEHRSHMLALHNEGRRGFGRSDEAVALREEFRRQMEAILTPEQLQQLESRRAERRTDRQSQMQEGATERHEQQIALLTSVLKLSDAQVAQVENILSSTHDKMQKLHESMNDGDFDRDAMHDSMTQIHEETSDAIKGALSDEQLGVFNALTDLLPSGPRGPRRPF